MYRIEIANEQDAESVNVGRLRKAVRLVLREEGVAAATVSVAIVDDECIRGLHRDYLSIDSATDVLSFVLEESKSELEGEVIASAETAAAAAARFGWPADDELLLYVIHGTLHLVGYDDCDSKSRLKMRARERRYLASFGLAPRYGEAQDSDSAFKPAYEYSAKKRQNEQSIVRSKV
jgi:probable rRNA maturation factor